VNAKSTYSKKYSHSGPTESGGQYNQKLPLDIKISTKSRAPPQLIGPETCANGMKSDHKKYRHTPKQVDKVVAGTVIIRHLHYERINVVISR
jgi:hypothetical protein